jgi:hypothetical protein
MLEHFSQRFPKDWTKKFLQKIDLLHATYWAWIMGPKLLNSVLCGLYLKLPRKSLQNLLFNW